MKKLLVYGLKKTILNWNRPVISGSLLEVCKRYVDLCNGDNNYNRYENGEYRFLEELQAQGKLNVVYDVGANVGDYASDVLKVNPKALVTCFEPDPRAYKQLATLKVNKFNWALGDKEEILPFNITPRSTHNSFIKTEEPLSVINIPIKRLDDLANDHIDLLKIDTEAYEFKVIKGAERLIREGKISHIQFECSGVNVQTRTFFKDYVDFFETYGYDLYKIHAKKLVKVKYNPSYESFSLCNYVAIKR